MIDGIWQVILVKRQQPDPRYLECEWHDFASLAEAEEYATRDARRPDVLDIRICRKH